jgi:hypothetical protein
VTLGFSPGRAVLLLIAVEAVLASVAVLTGRRVLPLGAAVASVVAVLGALSLYTSRAQVYAEGVVGLSRRVRGVLAGSALALFILAAPALVALARAQGPAVRASEVAAAGLSSLGEGDLQRGRDQLQAASALFHRAESRLDSPLVSVGLVVPGLSSNVAATRTLVELASELTADTARVASLAQAAAVPITPSTPPLADAERLAPVLADASRLLRSVEDDVLAAVRRPYIVPSLRKAMDSFAAATRSARRHSEQAAVVANQLPGLLGAHGERRYLLVFQDGDALQGVGGSVTTRAELIASGNSLRAEHLTAPANADSTPIDWDAAITSPDFPTVAEQMRTLYQKEAGRAVDGVLAMDASGLSALQQLIGSANSPASAGGASPVPSIWASALSSPLGTAGTVGRVLGDAARRGHLMLYLADPPEQELAVRLGADGGVPIGSEEALLVVNRSPAATEDATDLRRRVRYEVRVDPSGETADIVGQLEVSLTNSAGSDEPRQDEHGVGLTTQLSVFSPLATRGATLDGTGLPLDSRQLLGRRVEAASVTVPKEGTRTVRLRLEGVARLTAPGWYGLRFLRQPALVPDEIEVAIAVPKGWRIAEAHGLERSAERVARSRLDERRQHTLWVRLERSGWARVWSKHVSD